MCGMLLSVGSTWYIYVVCVCMFLGGGEKLERKLEGRKALAKICFGKDEKSSIFEPFFFLLVMSMYVM